MVSGTSVMRTPSALRLDDRVTLRGHAVRDHLRGPYERRLAFLVLADDQILIVFVGVDASHVCDRAFEGVVTAAASSQEG